MINTLFANFAAVQTHAANDGAGHGNTVITDDANDTITLRGVALTAARQRFLLCEGGAAR
ncbi:hypothetical protein EI171_30640 [Bradyrhizobium sp. LCT2]|uniref:hypothetical protein n=1 Tax=Bradyrhizobium sp. LCT2 TaxID=2493093 RepID=UPI001374267F|nr:hypothetical protein [Bradyrhizobium sp. LCT2]QHP71265.1 hypothetical protein EI171_30640 [Bradyrhizobium sp. LCT2]